MERTSDFEKLLFLYKTEDKDFSIELYCINNEINYRVFDRLYHNHRDGVVLVQLAGSLEMDSKTSSHINKRNHE
jgi:hypothetical protein